MILDFCFFPGTFLDGLIRDGVTLVWFVVVLPGSVERVDILGKETLSAVISLEQPLLLLLLFPNILPLLLYYYLPLL